MKPGEFTGIQYWAIVLLVCAEKTDLPYLGLICGGGRIHREPAFGELCVIEVTGDSRIYKNEDSSDMRDLKYIKLINLPVQL